MKQHHYYQDPHGVFQHAARPSHRARTWSVVRAWYFFPLHTILVIVLAVVALFSLNGRTFPTSADAPLDSTIAHIFRGDLRQADVTTLVAAALVLVRLTANVCASIAAERSIFILMEKCGITLHEIERIFCYQHGPLGLNAFKLATVLLLLLLVPAQLSAPLAQGALSWDIQLTLRPANYNVSLNVAYPGAAFFDFRDHVENRDFSIKRASGLAVIHRFGPDFYSVTNSTQRVPSRRWAPAFGEHKLADQSKGYLALPTNTSIGNTTLPFFRMSNMTWIDYEDDFDEYLQPHNGLFNVTGPMNPLRTSLLGNAVILRRSPLDSWVSAWPEATLLDTTVTLAVLTGRVDEAEPGTAACPNTSTVFGAIPATRRRIAVGRTGYTDCYSFATASVIAGTTQCLDCSIISPGVVQRPGNATAPFTLDPDPLVPLVMGMLPETMLSIVTGNATYAPTWRNLDGFLAGAFAAAYQASWNDLTDRLIPTPSSSDPAPEHAAPTATTNLSLPSYPLRAAVDPRRIHTWLALHLLVPVTGVLLALVQARCRDPPVIDFAAACLLTDPGPLVRRAPDRPFDRVTTADSRRLGPLVLVDQEADDYDYDYDDDDDDEDDDDDNDAGGHKRRGHAAPSDPPHHHPTHQHHRLHRRHHRRCRPRVLVRKADAGAPPPTPPASRSRWSGSTAWAGASATPNNNLRGRRAASRSESWTHLSLLPSLSSQSSSFASAAAAAAAAAAADARRASAASTAYEPVASLQDDAARANGCTSGDGSGWWARGGDGIRGSGISGNNSGGGDGGQPLLQTPRTASSWRSSTSSTTTASPGYTR